MSHPSPQLVARIAQEVSRRLPQWYGEGTALVGDDGRVEARPFSYLIHYRAVTPDARRVPLVVKVSRPSPDESGPGPRPRRTEEMREYHDTLVEIGRAFAHEPGHCYIRSLGYLDDCDAVVMEALGARSLRKEFDHWRMGLGLSSDRRRFLSHLSLGGRWLRLYHERVGRITVERVTHGDLRSVVAERLDHLRDASEGRIDTRPLERSLADLIDRITDTRVPHALVHKDYSYANVLVTPDGRVGSVDCRRRYGAVHEDLAHIVVDGYSGRWQASSHGLMYSRRFLNRCRTAILDGYGDSSSIGSGLLDFYCGLEWVKKWIQVERRRHRDESLARKAAVIWMRPYLKRVLAQLRTREDVL